MEELVQKYADKLIHAGLAESSGEHQPLVGGLDDTLIWNRKAREQKVLETVFPIFFGDIFCIFFCFENIIEKHESS